MSSAPPNPHNDSHPKKKSGFPVNLLWYLLLVILIAEFLHRTVSRIGQMSQTLALVDWGAMFNLGIFLIMVASAIKIAVEPIVKLLKKNDDGHHDH